ncbi:hypothetical protein M3Y98_00372400 [Aphelenchoides besseyi]|nr:hypothetical protein M3Y98_00372400 [Aphelenchoides besseyi]KAI6201823.1 hypothetical protein M3Y96_00883300 [Aphelenchoides besseyi]
MHGGWFSAFREDFAPTSYGTLTNPCINVRTIMVFLAFIVPYLSFLVVFPGLREKRLISFTTITVQLGVGVLLIASIVLPYWSVGDAVIVSQFKSHSTSRHESKIGVRVGLTTINVTLKYVRSVDDEAMIYNGMYFNEKFSLDGVSSMATELESAYYDGLPYPMLKVLEYFSLSQGAFAWGKQYRNAGHFASTLVWTSFAAWLWQCVFLAFLPHHYGKIGVICGVFAIAGDLVYIFLAPNGPSIPFVSSTQETTYLNFYYGSSFYMSLAAGLISIIFGTVLTVLQYIRWYSLSTCLSSNLDVNVGPRCRYGRQFVLPLDETQPSSSCSEVSTYMTNEESADGKHLGKDLARSRPNKLLARTKHSGTKTNTSGMGTGGSSGFQSSSSLRSSTNSTLSSSTSGGIQRTLSTDTIGHSHLTDDDDSRSPGAAAERFAHPHF